MKPILRRHLLALMLGVTTVTLSSAFLFNTPAMAKDGSDDSGSHDAGDDNDESSGSGSDDGPDRDANDDNGGSSGSSADDGPDDDANDDNGANDANDANDASGKSGSDDSCKSDPLTCKIESMMK
jgi:hypothetical protein